MRRGDWSATSPRRASPRGPHPQARRLRCERQAVARRAAAFDLRLLAWVRHPDKYRERAAAAGRAIGNSTNCSQRAISFRFTCRSWMKPATCSTRFGWRRSEARRGVDQTARGAIVDEAALIDALRNEKIAGAALDVFEGIDVFALPGPPPPHPLFGLDNVILTPHCAGSSVESTRESKVRGTANAVDVLLGRRPKYIVNPQVVPRFPLTDPEDILTGLTGWTG